MGQRLVNGRDDTKQNDHLHRHRQTTAGHADAVFFVQLHLLLLQLFGILRVFFLQPFQPRRQLGAFRLRFLRFQRQREHRRPHQQGEQENRHEVVAEDVVDEVQDVSQRDGNDVKNLHKRSSHAGQRPADLM